MASHRSFAVTADAGIQLSNVPLHEFVHCPLSCLPTQTVQSYAVTSALTELVSIPGHTDTAIRADTDTLVILRRMYDCLWVLHGSGFTLKGKLTGDNFLLDSRLSVKMYGIHLSRFTEPDGDLDCYAFARVIVDMFMMEEGVPEDIAVWLDLICNRVRGSEYLIRYHTALMAPLQAANFLLDARLKLEGLRHTDSQLYRRIIRMNPEYYYWNVDSECINHLMADARKYKDPVTNKESEFEEDISGVLKLVRNCRQHQARQHGQVFVLIVRVDFPYLLHDIQRSMFHAGLLGEFHLEETMK